MRYENIRRDRCDNDYLKGRLLSTYLHLYLAGKAPRVQHRIFLWGCTEKLAKRKAPRVQFRIVLWDCTGKLVKRVALRE